MLYVMLYVTLMPILLILIHVKRIQFPEYQNNYALSLYQKICFTVLFFLFLFLYMFYASFTIFSRFKQIDLRYTEIST